MSNCKLPHLAHIQNQERGTPVITANQSKATIKMLPAEAASHYEATSKYKAALHGEAASKDKTASQDEAVECLYKCCISE